ncbi:MAG: hypothetical protein RLZZ08_1928 [Pseudomonadota bacterium]
MNDAKRTQIKTKVEAGQLRNAAKSPTALTDRIGEKAIEAKDSLTRFATEHPVATVAGGLAVGVLISTLFRKSPTRRVAGKASSRAAALVALGAELALAYTHQAMQAAEQAAGDARRAGADRLEDLSESVGDTARGLRRGASRQASKAGDSARHVSDIAGHAITRALRRVR